MSAQSSMRSSRRPARLSPVALASFAVATLLLGGSPLQAADYTWAVAVGDWSIASNWGGTLLPTSTNDTAYVLNGGTVNVTQPNETCGTLALGGPSGGNVQMTGGQLYSVPYEYIGYSGAGAFTQTGGTNSLSSSLYNPFALYLGYNAGSSGTYNLSGNGQLSTGNAEYVGYSGTGTFIQSGGSVYSGGIGGQSLYIGCNAGSSGTYNLSGNGQLTMTEQYVGYSGTGAFVQTGGNNSTGVNGALELGVLSGSGSYNLSAGSLAAGFEYVGYNGSGTFTQSGGTNSVGYAFTMGMGSSSTYSLGGGLLSVQEEYLNTGIFTQTGGVHLIGDELSMFSATGASSIFNLSDGLLSAPREVFGGSGSTTFNQSGGTQSVSGNFFLGYVAGIATYNLSGSSCLSAAGEYVGYSGTGSFTQSGGTNSTYLVLSYGTGSTGTYNLNGGLLVLQGLTPDSNTAVFNFSGGTLQAGGSFSTSEPMTLGVCGSGATFDTAGYAVSLSGSLSGSGSLTKVDSGTLTLAATNTYSGNTLVSGGTLLLGSPLALQNSTLDTSGSGMLSFGSLSSATFGGLIGPGTLGLANSGAVALSVGNSNAGTTFSGMLQGVGSLNKIGSGVLALYGSNTYTGPTTITQGKLTIDGWLPNSAVSVNGGTLAGSGFLSSVTVSSSGNLAPGDTLGTLSVSGSLILELGALMEYEFDTPTTSSMIDVGTLALNSQQFSDFHFATTANCVPGTYDLIEATSPISGSLGASTSGTVDGYAATLAVQGDNLVLTVVPEPSTIILFAAGAIGLIGYGSWRRRQKGSKSVAENVVVDGDQDDGPGILAMPSRWAETARRAA